MNTWVEAPPPRKGLGCFGRGCLILLVFAIVLAIACFAGMYWGLHRHSALFYGIYWLAKTRSIAEAPTPVPEFSAFGPTDSTCPGNAGRISNRKRAQANQRKLS